MNEQDISAEEAAINNAIQILEDNEGHEWSAEAAATASAWADIAKAIAAHNSNVVVLSLAEAARLFVKTPSPEHYAELAAAVEQYIELG